MNRDNPFLRKFNYLSKIEYQILCMVPIGGNCEHLTQTDALTLSLPLRLLVWLYMPPHSPLHIPAQCFFRHLFSYLILYCNFLLAAKNQYLGFSRHGFLGGFSDLGLRFLKIQAFLKLHCLVNYHHMMAQLINRF